MKSIKNIKNWVIAALMLSTVYFAAGDNITSWFIKPTPHLYTSAEKETKSSLPKMDKSLLGKLFICTGNQVRLHNWPDFTESTVLPGIRLFKGDTVTIIGQSVEKFQLNNLTGCWYQVRLASGQEAWVFYYLEQAPELPRPPNLPPALEGKFPTSDWEKAKDWVSKKYRTNFGSKADRILVSLQEACDFMNPIVRNAAVREAVKYQSKGKFNLGQVANLYEFAAKNWNYVEDPGFKEYVAKASESIRNHKSGDCEDFAVLVYSLITAIGGDARINYVYEFEDGHAFTEVNLGADVDKELVLQYISIRFNCDKNDISGIRYDDSGNCWLNLDWFDDPKHPGGAYFEWEHGISFVPHLQSYSEF